MSGNSSLADYEVLNVIGKGTFGRVSKIRKKMTNQVLRLVISLIKVQKRFLFGKSWIIQKCQKKKNINWSKK